MQKNRFWQLSWLGTAPEFGAAAAQGGSSSSTSEAALAAATTNVAAAEILQLRLNPCAASTRVDNAAPAQLIFLKS